MSDNVDIFRLFYFFLVFASQLCPLRNQLVRTFIHSSIRISLPICFSIALCDKENRRVSIYKHHCFIRNGFSISNSSSSLRPLTLLYVYRNDTDFIPTIQCARVCLHLIRKSVPIIRLLATLATLTHNGLFSTC